MFWQRQTRWIILFFLARHRGSYLRFSIFRILRDERASRWLSKRVQISPRWNVTPASVKISHTPGCKISSSKFNLLKIVVQFHNAKTITNVCASLSVSISLSLSVSGINRRFFLKSAEGAQHCSDNFSNFRPVDMHTYAEYFFFFSRFFFLLSPFGERRRVFNNP